VFSGVGVDVVGRVGVVAFVAVAVAVVLGRISWKYRRTR
jgi:hypothetical protein